MARCRGNRHRQRQSQKQNDRSRERDITNAHLETKKIRNTKCRDIHNRQRQRKRNVGPILRDKKQSYRDSHTNTYIDRHLDKDTYTELQRERGRQRQRHGYRQSQTEDNDRGRDTDRETETEYGTERETERNGQRTSCKKSYLNAVLRQQRYITVIESDVAFENVCTWSKDSFEPRSVELSTLQSTNGHDGRCTGTIQQ